MNYIGKYPHSFLIYCSMLLLTLLLAYVAMYRNKKGKNPLVLIIMIILSLSIFAGIRGNNVGLDTAHYIIYHMEPIKNGNFGYVNQPFLFKLITLFAYKIFDNTNFVLGVYAFLINSFIVLRFWELRNKSNFVFSMFFYYCCYYLITFNVFRQFISIAIIFWATRFIEKKEYKKFILSIIVAMGIHTSAILGLLYIPISIIIKSSKNVKKVLIVFSPIVLAVAIILFLSFFDYNHYLILYEKYSYGNPGFMVPTKIVLGTFFILMLSKEKRRNPLLKEVTFIYFIGILISLITFVSAFADRFAWYFLMYEPVFISQLNYNNKKNTILKNTIYGLIIIYTLYVCLSKSGQGIMPYYTFFS